MAIASNLDGFTTVPQDLGGSRMMTDLIDAISAMSGISIEWVGEIVIKFKQMPSQIALIVIITI
jgi:hypothetical protein